MTKSKSIFVFGSNLAGRHGKGAALYAKQFHGAIYGQGVGRQGNSYAIPTKDEKLKVLEISEIEKYIDLFVEYTRENQDLEFIVTPIGCGLAGYSYAEIGPLFEGVPDNVILPDEFLRYIYG